MSDIRLYNLKKQKELKITSVTKSNLQELIEANSLSLLGVEVIFSNINITGKNGEIVESFGYDEDKRLVVIEYHQGKNSPTIHKGLEYLDYIRNNLGKIKVLFKEKLGDEAKELIYDPRLIVIGEDFNSYDGKAITFLPFDIDLIKCILVDKDIIVLEKIYQNFASSDAKLTNDDNINKLYRLIDEVAYSYGDELCKSYLNGCASYRRIKNFMYVYYLNGLNVVLKIDNKFKSFIIKSEKDLEKITPLIEEAYDEN